MRISTRAKCWNIARSRDTDYLFSTGIKDICDGEKKESPSTLQPTHRWGVRLHYWSPHEITPDIDGKEIPDTPTWAHTHTTTDRNTVWERFFVVETHTHTHTHTPEHMCVLVWYGPVVGVRESKKETNWKTSGALHFWSETSKRYYLRNRLCHGLRVICWTYLAANRVI